MKDYLMLIVIPSKTLDKLNDKKPGFLTLYLVVTLAIAGSMLPNTLQLQLTTPKDWKLWQFSFWRCHLYIFC
jgi:hypothetical protein